MDFNFYYPNNINKYIGRIIKRRKKYIFRVKNKKYNFSKDFFVENYENLEELYDDVVKFKRKWNIENDTIINKYMKRDGYLLVDLGKDEYMKVEEKHLDIVDKYNWKLQNRMEHPTAYYVSELGFGNYFLFQELAYDTKYIFQKNGDKLDYSEDNVEIITEEMRSWLINNKKEKTNQNLSGFKGVYKVKTGDYEYWMVSGVTYKGRQIVKRFSIRKYGEMKAKSRAIKYRERYINTGYIIKDIL
jgi:hypothetical protein